MDHKEELEQATVRLDCVLWVANEMANFDATSEGFREFCEDLPERKDAPLYSALPCLSRFADGDEYPTEEEITEALFFGNVKGGFIVQAAHPVMTWRGQTGSMYSWGYYNTEWLYAPDLDGVVSAAVEWAKNLDDKAKAEQLSEPA